MSRGIDVLNRQDFIDNLVRVTRQLADNHKGCTFAIDGKWGIGKTYILDAFEDQIGLFQDPNAAGDRYAVFRYNCWQYDYYDEPAVAIIAAIRNAVKEYQKLLPNAPPEIKAMFEIAKDLGADFISNVIETKFGWNPKQAIESAKKYKDLRKLFTNEDKETHNYDSFFEFKTVLNKAKKQLEEMAKDKPIIILVDELDRCMPEYAIKVLERLHHLFENQSNIVVILAYDQSRLDNAIQSIYGIQEPDVPHFMKKFISFSLHLDTGELSDTFWEKHKDYLKNFDTPDSTNDTLIQTLPVNLFSGVDIRTQEKIMERIEMLHKLVFDGFSDLSVLYFELLHQVLTYRYSQIPVSQWITSINHAPIFELEKHLGHDLYEYIHDLERTVYNGTIITTGNADIRPELYVLTESPLSLAFLYFAAINHHFDGRHCNYYALQKPSHNFDSIIMFAQKFDQLASTIK